MDGGHKTCGGHYENDEVGIVCLNVCGWGVGIGVEWRITDYTVKPVLDGGLKLYREYDAIVIIGLCIYHFWH